MTASDPRLAILTQALRMTADVGTRDRRLGPILLAAFLVLPSCTLTEVCPGPDGGTFSLVSVADGGRVADAPCDEPYAACFDGGSDAGFDCLSACATFLPSASYFAVLQCALLSLPDGGAGLGCIWEEGCP